MAYLDKQTILRAYKTLAGITSKPSKQGATQNVSALRYFTALDRYHTEHRKACDTRDRADKAKFAEYVGEVCAVTNGLYTANFYWPLVEHNGDFNVGSNFYSAGQVRVSLASSDEYHDYPVRGNAPLIQVKNGQLIRRMDYYANVDNYLPGNTFKVAYAIWLLRNQDIEGLNPALPMTAMQEALRKHYSQEFVDAVLPDNAEIGDIDTCNAPTIISAKDIDTLFAEDTTTPSPAVLPQKYVPYIAAIKTKPFLLLAGISGTGKSRIVREMARCVWPEGSEERGAQSPANFMMVPVRPNWHDSTELIGYYSSIRREYVPGPFLQFVARAWEMPGVPCFLCLDEMNLAPVEQYFAEYLSCIESRSVVGGEVVTDCILPKQAEEWWQPLCSKLTQNNTLYERFRDHGISLPPNLVVCGTVNMDETTHAFSRKVLDRAMTIEMNEVNLRAGLGEKASSLPRVEPSAFLAADTTVSSLYDQHKEAMDTLVSWMEDVNKALDGSPFKIAYRSRNEILLYVVHAMQLGTPMKAAFDQAVNMKILPRIEGDLKKVQSPLGRLTATLTQILGEDGEGSASLAKLAEMDARTRDQYYCTYWT